MPLREICIIGGVVLLVIGFIQNNWKIAVLGNSALIAATLFL